MTVSKGLYKSQRGNTFVVLAVGCLPGNTLRIVAYEKQDGTDATARFSLEEDFEAWVNVESGETMHCYKPDSYARMHGFVRRFERVDA